MKSLLTNYYLDPTVAETCNRAIMITGSARSGTTILGKVLHSMAGVEYIFEPPSMLGLFTTLDRMDEQTWKYLFRVNLYEQLFVNNLAGRNINCNQADDSSIYRVKSKAEVAARQARSFSKLELQGLAAQHTAAFKLPSLVPFLEQFAAYFPDVRMLYVRRSALECLNSLKHKAWLGDQALATENRVWPLVEYNDRLLPYWVKPADYDFWLGLDEINRCAYYFIEMNRNVDLPNIIEVHYEELLNNPTSVIGSLAQKLNLEFGDLTQSLIDSIQPTQSQRDFQLLEHLIPAFRDQLQY